MNLHYSWVKSFSKRFQIMVTLLIFLIFILDTVLPGAGRPSIVNAKEDSLIQLSGTLFAMPEGFASGECASWQTACDLQYILSNTTGPAEVWVKMGSYFPTNDTVQTASFQLKNGVALYGGFFGNETVLEQRNPGVNITILSGEIGTINSSDNSYHVVMGNSTDASAILDGFIIQDGNAAGAGPNNRAGGGMLLSYSSPKLRNLVFKNNNATSNGGGLSSVNSNPELSDVTFWENHATFSGAGIYSVMGAPVLNNVTFSNNDAGSYGGGLDAYSSSITLHNITFSDNSASLGGAIYNENFSSLEMVNSLLWGNTLDQIYNEEYSTLSVSYSDVQGGYPGEGNLDADPLLGVLGNYGGSTPVLPLLPGSAAIDTGDDSVCLNGDQRGISRPQLGHCDMGAYESRGFTLAISYGDNQSTPANSIFYQPLEVSVSSLHDEPVDGGELTFTVPDSGPSAAISDNPAMIETGIASAGATANAFPGAYQVGANLVGADSSVSFNLTNTLPTGVLMVIPGGLNSGNCSNWGSGCDLQYALTSAALDSELWVKWGTYTPTSGTDRAPSFVLRSGVALYGGFEGTETVRDQRDPVNFVTTLSGEIGEAGYGDNTYHVVNGSGTDDSAVLDGFTVRSGNAYGSTDGNGGGMYIINGTPTIKQVIFTDNKANLGAGMYNSGSRPALYDASFTSNLATAGGGGMYNLNSSPVITDGSFDGNMAEGRGGGISCMGDGFPLLRNVTFSSNSAVRGAGISNGVVSSGYYFTLINITFIANVASDVGSGIYNEGGNMDLANVTFFANAAENDEGGGVYNETSGSVNITNSIVWGNGPTPLFSDTSSTTAVTYSDVQLGYPGMGNISADPLLGPFGYYGGMTQVLPLLPGSAAIAAGIHNSSCWDTDQRGVPRPQSSCDMGAYESRGFTLAISSGDNQSTIVGTDFQQPLVVIVSSAFAEPVDGGYITFTPPVGGPSAELAGSSMVIAGGVAQVNATANNEAGNYLVLAGASGALPVNFHLANLMGAFGKLLPADGAGGQFTTLILSWQRSAGASEYEYCVDTSDNDTCDGDAWHAAGSSLSAELNSLLPNTQYYWQVRSIAGSFLEIADSGTWWSFTIQTNYAVYLPSIRK
jgi:predicted outer membrane repeat protein